MKLIIFLKNNYKINVCIYLLYVFYSKGYGVLLVSHLIQITKLLYKIKRLIKRRKCDRK